MAIKTDSKAKHPVEAAREQSWMDFRDGQPQISDRNRRAFFAGWDAAMLAAAQAIRAERKDCTCHPIATPDGVMHHADCGK